MPNVTIYINKHNWDKFSPEDNKGGLVNELLENHYGVGGGSERVAASTKKVTKSNSKKDTFNQLKQQLENVCTGDHYMSRRDCGKKSCPWGIV